MVYETCPMFSGYGYGGFYSNWIFIAIIFSLIFWGTYFLLIKQTKKRKK